MGSSSKKRQTMQKMTRERAVKEKRALKQEKKDEKKLAAAMARDAEAAYESRLADPESQEDGDEPSQAEDESPALTESSPLH